jgi:hypothetical protein
MVEFDIRRVLCCVLMIWHAIFAFLSLMLDHYSALKSSNWRAVFVSSRRKLNLYAKRMGLASYENFMSTLSPTQHDRIP